MRPGINIDLSSADRLRLEALVRDRNTAQKHVWRARIVLLSASGILNNQDEDVFKRAFDFLATTGDTPEVLFDDILARLFNARTAGPLHVEYLVGGDGELALRVGDSDQAFGIVNVGDAKKVADLCEQQGETIRVSRREFTDSMFHTLDDDDSSLNVLIGSKRFSEGWNSYRVSTMGLLHMGKTEGSEIIQLFGRGVRLRGFGGSLKRSGAIHWASKGGEFAWVPKDPDLPLLETLNVFGVKSDYMARFNEFLDGEGIARSDDRMTYEVPTTIKLPSIPLITIRIPDGIEFASDAKLNLERPPADFLPKRRVTLDWYPRVLARDSRLDGDSASGERLHEARLTKSHLAFLDMDKIYLALLRYKSSTRN